MKSGWLSSFFFRFSVILPQSDLLCTVTEPFIVPALYEEYIGKVAGIDVVDEWTLSLAMGSDLATRMEQHYKTFIVCFLLL